jgi:hypothetical protein
LIVPAPNWYASGLLARPVIARWPPNSTMISVEADVQVSA